LFLVGFFNPKNSGLVVESQPTSLVFINGVQVGRTPYEETRAPQEITLKLVPETNDKQFTFFETKLSLVSGVRTIVRRVFAETEETSSGEVISFEKIGGRCVNVQRTEQRRSTYPPAPLS